MKLAIITTIYKRHILTRIVLKHYEGLAKKHDLILVAVGSEGKKSKTLCEQCGWNYLEYRNLPLSKKVEAGILKAKELGADLFCAVGSDDVMDENIIKYYLSSMKPDSLFMLGLRDLYFYSIQKNKSLHWLGYKNKKFTNVTVGAFRVMSRAFLDKIDWRLCDKDNTLAIDHQWSDKINKLWLEERGYRMKDCNGVAVDIKCGHNLTTFEALYPNSVFIGNKIIYDKFPELLSEIVINKNAINDDK